MLHGAMAIKMLAIVAKSRGEFYFKQLLREQTSCVAQHGKYMKHQAIGLQLKKKKKIRLAQKGQPNHFGTILFRRHGPPSPPLDPLLTTAVG